MIELRRNVIFGQYADTGSVIHGLDPRFKMMATALVMVAAFAIKDLAGFIALLPLLVAIQIISRVSLGYLARGSRFFLIFLAVILVFGIVFAPGGSGELWRWNFLSISTSALVSAAILGARVLVLYWASTMLMLTTSMVDLTDGVESILSPLQRVGVPVNELVLVGVIAFKFVPIFTTEAERLLRARAARGMPVDQGNPLERTRRLGSLLIPIFVSGFRRADALATAMDARCYRGGRYRTKYRRLDTSRQDWLALAIVAVWTAGTIWLSVRIG